MASGCARARVPAARIECHPMRWMPATDQLVVYPITRWTFSHDGAVRTFAPITRDRNRIANRMLMNWSAVDFAIPVHLAQYQGEYLFVYPSAYQSALQPLINQKKWRGFSVTGITLE